MANEVEITNEGLDYTSVEDFSNWISTNKAGLASNDIPNNNQPDNKRIRESLLFAESEFDSYAQEQYDIPVSGTMKSMFYIKKLCYSLAKYNLFGRRGITKESYFEYTANKKDLESIKDGRIKIPGVSTRKNESGIKLGSENEAHFSQMEKEGFSI